MEVPIFAYIICPHLGWLLNNATGHRETKRGLLWAARQWPGGSAGNIRECQNAGRQITEDPECCCHHPQKFWNSRRPRSGNCWAAAEQKGAPKQKKEEKEVQRENTCSRPQRTTSLVTLKKCCWCPSLSIHQGLTPTLGCARGPQLAIDPQPSFLCRPLLP